MDALKKKTKPGLPPWPRRALELTSFSTMPPSILPSAPAGSLQGWKRPYSMNSTSSVTMNSTSSVTKTPSNLSDAITIPSSPDDNKKQSQNICVPFDNKNSTTKDVVAKPAIPSGDQDKSVKTQAMPSGVQIRSARAIDPNMDPKKLKRIISNRVSAQKSRLKKLQYLTEIERTVKALEDEIAVLSPQVALYSSHQQALKIEHKRLNMEVSTQTRNKMLRDAEIEENKAEVSRLRQLYLTQQQQQAMLATWQNGFNQQMAMSPNMFQLSLERMVYMTSNQAKIGESIEEADRLNQSNMKQNRDGGRCILGWDPSEQEMANSNLRQLGSPTVLQEKLNMNPQLGGIEQMMTFNSKPINQDLDS